jgi:hypothetical protein
MNKRNRIFLVFVLFTIVSCSEWGLRRKEWRERFASFDYTSDIPVPRGTVAYAEHLCRSDRIIPVYGFVGAKSTFNEYGCTRAQEAWVLDNSIGQWRRLPKNKVILCCDPLKGFNRMSI